MDSLQTFTSTISFELELPLTIPPNITYEEKHALLSSTDRVVNVLFQKSHLFSVLVPKNVFNPYMGSAANKLIELVLQNKVDVRDLRVIDLGCGSGVIGLACIYAGASKVLFTDINSNVLTLQQHPMLRSVDEVKVQDLLFGERDESFDLVIMSTPTYIVDNSYELQLSSYKIAIQRKAALLYDVISQTARVLTKGGILCLWVRMPLDSILSYHAFIMELQGKFDFRNNENPCSRLRG